MVVVEGSLDEGGVVVVPRWASVQFRVCRRGPLWDVWEVVSGRRDATCLGSYADSAYAVGRAVLEATQAYFCAKADWERSDNGFV